MLMVTQLMVVLVVWVKLDMNQCTSTFLTGMKPSCWLSEFEHSFQSGPCCFPQTCIRSFCWLPMSLTISSKCKHWAHRCEVISLAEATHQLLEQRAATSEIGSSPQPYDILYDLHTMRGNYKAAAAAQYNLAMRIREEGQHLPHALARIAAALCKTLTCCFAHCGFK